MDPAHLPSLIPILQTLLKDRSPLSAGAVAIAFQTICPTRLDLLHTHYRRLCRILLDVDPWGQVNVLELLARYARSMLPKPSVINSNGKDGISDTEEIDPDLQLLLSNAEPLFLSNNPAVSLFFSVNTRIKELIQSFSKFTLCNEGCYDCFSCFLLSSATNPTIQNCQPSSSASSHIKRDRANYSC